MELLSTPPCDPFFMGAKPVVVIEMESGDQFKVELDPSAAPITVAYFLTLVNKGFYNGTRFHRVVPGFLIQGGDPSGTGDGETEYYVKGEFSANGVNNPLRHTEGTISLARQDGFNTASCQFFVTVEEIDSMDGEYAAFGHVIEGMDVVEDLGYSLVDENSTPLEPLVMKRVYVQR